MFSHRIQVILTTVGPYNRYGSKLVEACARGGVHLCDLTGESIWVRDMIDKHHALAESTGAKIVPSCGFDSIPAVSTVACDFLEPDTFSLLVRSWLFACNELLFLRYTSITNNQP